MRGLQLLLWALLLQIGAGALLNAQPTATFQNPGDEETGVPLQPTIIISTLFPIDSSSITWVHPQDPSTPPDSTPPTIQVIPASMLALPDSLWHLGAVSGTYQLNGLQTLQFTPNEDLHWETEYHVTVKNLRVIDSLSNPVYVSEESIVFTTVERPHHFLSSSKRQGDHLCPNDTVSFRFNRKIDSISTWQGGLLELERVYLDSNLAWGDSTVPVGANYWLSNDSLTVYATPTGTLQQGQPHRFKINTGYLSGDSDDDRAIALYVRERFDVTLKAAPIDSTESLSSMNHPFPNPGDNYYESGETVDLAAGWISEFRFVKWSAPDVPSVHNSTSPTVTFTQCCKDVVVTALYERIPTDSMHVYAADSGGSVIVYGYDYDSLGLHGTYGVPDGQGVWLSAVPDNGYKFDEWASSVTSLSGLTDWFIDIPSNVLGNGWIKPVFEPVSVQVFQYCGSIGGESGKATLDVACHTTGTPESKTITCSITDPTGTNECYRIMSRTNPDGTVVDFSPNGVTTDALGWTTQADPIAQVRWVVKKLKFTLSVTKELDVGGPAPPEAKVEVSPNKEIYDCGETVTLTAVDDPDKGVEFVEWQPGGSTNKTIQVTMDENKSYTAVFSEDFRVTNIYWFTENNATTAVPYKPEQTVQNVQVVPMTPKPSTEVTIEFSRPVNTSTVDGNSLFIQEAYERIDGQTLQKYDPGSVTFAQWYNNNTQLKLKLHNNSPDLAVRKFQTLFLTYKGGNTGIKSASNTQLKNPGRHVARTENPDARFKLDRVLITYDEDPGGSGEIFGGWVAARQNDNGTSHTWSADMPGSGGKEDISAPPNTAAVFTQNQEFLATSIDDEESLSMGVIVYDDDKGDLLQKIATVVATVAAVVEAVPDNLLHDKTAVKIAARLLGAAAKEAKDWIDSDDFVTSADFTFGAADLWGAKADISQRQVWYESGAVRVVIVLE